MSYVVRNARAEAITVTIRQDGLWRFNLKLSAQSIEGRRTDADSFAWEVPVPANGETELTHGSPELVNALRTRLLDSCASGTGRCVRRCARKDEVVGSLRRERIPWPSRSTATTSR